MQNRKGERQKDLEGPEHLAEEGQIGGGRSGGSMARDVGSEDELKRAFERPAGITRVKKSKVEPNRPNRKKPSQ